MTKTTQIQIGDQTYEVAPMDLEQLEEFLSLQGPISEAGTIKEQMGFMVEAVKVALCRAAPNLDIQTIKRSLTWDGLTTALSSASEAAGLVKAAQGEPGGLPIGTASTQTLSTEPGGPSEQSEA